jgi:SnoaL-like domain
MTPDQLSDRAEINDLINRYGEGVRVRDIEMVASCFSDDAVLDYGPAVVTGADAIRAFFGGGTGAGSGNDRSVLALDERVASTPLMSNVMIELNDDDEAHCESMCLAIHAGFAAGEGSVIVRGTRNVDDLVRTAAGWRIRHRIHATVWSFQIPGTPVVEGH